MAFLRPKNCRCRQRVNKVVRLETEVNLKIITCVYSTMKSPAVVLSAFRTYDSAPCTKHPGIHTLGDHVFRKNCLFCYHLEDSFRQLLGWPKQLKFTEHTSAGACKHFVNSVKKSRNLSATYTTADLCSSIEAFSN